MSAGKQGPSGSFGRPFYRIVPTHDGLCDIWLTPGEPVPIYDNLTGRIDYNFKVLTVRGIREDDPQYGGDLVSFEEVDAYDFGVKQLPAGIYTYRVQDTLVDMIRAYDSTGARTVAYTMKAIHGQTEPTMAALRDAMRGFRAQ